MKKISWTCERCGLWHSYPSDAHLRPVFGTYDGLPSAATALLHLTAQLAAQIPADYLVRVASSPIGFKASWMMPAQLGAADLRKLVLSPVAGQPFPYICAACGNIS